MKNSIFLRLRNYFATGVITTIPIFITIYVVLWIIDVFSRLLPDLINPNKYLPFKIPGIEILIACILLTILGMISATLFGRRLLRFSETILEKIPVLRTIYSSVNQLTQSFGGKDNNSLNKKVVLVEFPSKGSWAVGFTTSEPKNYNLGRLQGNFASVFVPTTPNPTGGYLLIVEKTSLIYLNMNFEDAMKFIISVGAIGELK